LLTKIQESLLNISSIIYFKGVFRMGLFSRIILGIVFVLVLGLLLVGYYGFVPGLSDLMGANKPRDLGVKYTAADLTSANSKLGVTLKTLPPTDNGIDSLTRSGQKQVTTSFTSAELTALFNDHSQRWKYYPIKDIQVKISDDGTVEMSGVLLVDRFKGFADAVGIPEASRAQVRPYLTPLSSNPSFYIRGTLSVTDNNVQTNIEEVQVGRLVISGDQIQSYAYVIDSFIQQRANGRIIHLNSASFSGGLANLDLVIPQEVGLTPP
jgi:hypothetical protein